MSGSYREEDTSLVQFGILHPEVTEVFGLPADTLYFHIDYDKILDRYKNRDIRFRAISKYQTINRELNFMMPVHTPTAEVARLIDTTHPWITDVSVASIYEDSTKVGV